MPSSDAAGATTDRLPAASTLTRRQRRERTIRALITAAETQSPRRREALLEYVVRLNLSVALDVGTRHLEPGLDGDRIMQVACDALARAARTFDPAQDEDFLSYAVREIQRKLGEHGPPTWAVPDAAGWTPGT
jgi:DNA-directed RNA polymerase specialized sigma subunit